MNTAVGLHTLHHLHGHGSGFGALFSTIAHAAIWSIVGRIIWHAPVLVVVAAGVAAAGYIVTRTARRRRGVDRKP